MNQMLFYGRKTTPLKKLLLLHMAAGNKLIEYTATGNPVSFVTNLEKELTGLIVGIEPVQSGSGDPSPENVRPITGWTGANVYRTGKNLFDIDDKTEIGWAALADDIKENLISLPV